MADPSGDNNEAITDLCKILGNDTIGAKTKFTAVEYLLDLTGTKEGRDFLQSAPEVFKIMAKLVTENKQILTTQICLKFFVNFTSIESISFNPELLPDFKVLLNWCLDAHSLHSQLCSFVLSNCTRTKEGAAHVLGIIELGVSATGESCIKKLVDCYCDETFNKQKQVLHYLGLMLANLATVKAGARLICTTTHFYRLVSFLNHPVSLTRKRAACMLARNCALDSDLHEWMLKSGENVEGNASDLLVQLLLPLCDGADQQGNEGNLDDDEIDKLPIELQYLDEDKVREDDMETRQMLVETVWLLCADETGRKIVKDQGTYRLIDKLYKWECEKGDTGEKSEIAEAELKLIELLIGDEPQYEEHLNFLKVDIPEEIQKIL